MRVVDSIFLLLHIPSTGNICCLVTRLEHSQQRPLERLSPQGVDDGVGAAVEDGDGVGKHAQQWVVGVQVDDLNLPPNHVGHVAHCQDEGHDGDGGPPPLIQFALKRWWEKIHFTFRSFFCMRSGAQFNWILKLYGIFY